MSDAEKWQRAKAYIEREIETREFAAKSGRLDRASKIELRHEIGIYKTILDRAESDVPTRSALGGRGDYE